MLLLRYPKIILVLIDIVKTHIFFVNDKPVFKEIKRKIAHKALNFLLRE